MSPSAHKHYLLSVLMVILAFNYVDSLALGLLLQDIKLDLHLSDTQLGFLSGIAFALFYSVLGIPIARWADRGNRVQIISLTTLLWSAAVALCGLAGSFWQLLLIRIGVAVGEAGCIPPAHSLIADYFTRAERPRAVATYMLGGSLSAVIGYFLAGWLNEFFGWRATFVLLGLPGLGLAALAWFTIKEPRLGKRAWGTGDQTDTLTLSQAECARSSSTPPALKQVVAVLWRNRTFRHLLLSFSVMIFFGNGITRWQPTFFIRTHDLQTGELGTWFALIWGVGGVLGTYWGGAWASRYAANNERLQLKVMAIVYCGFGLISTGVYLAPSPNWAFAFLALAALGVSTATGPLFATIQTLVPEHMRAISIAIVYLFANLIGMGLGPLAAGALSDALNPTFGEDSLRYALLALCPGYLWGAWHVWRASTTVTRDAAAMQIARHSTPGGSFAHDAPPAGAKPITFE